MNKKTFWFFIFLHVVELRWGDIGSNEYIWSRIKKYNKQKKERDWAAAVGSLWVFGGGRDEGRIKHNYNKLTQTAMKIE